MLGRTLRKISGKMGAMSSSSSSSGPSKILLAMDFDHTVIHGNTDVEIQGLAEKDKMPAYLKDQVWTDYMQAVFTSLHEQGKREKDLKIWVQRLPFVAGMRELLTAVGKAENIELIIISDSNSIFIDWILNRHELKDCVDRVFSNPAEFDENGALKIRYFHSQDWCELSGKNMCKGYILEDYVKEREKEGTKFAKIVFVGDGRNDLCPAARLKKTGTVCARKGYKLEQVLRNGYKLNAKVIYWESGAELFECLDLTPPEKPENSSDQE